MTILSRASCRRLSQLPKTPAIWEGDRRPVSSSLSLYEIDAAASVQGDCILWVDGHEGVVRGIDVIPSDTGPEAIVRTLLQAMERPHGNALPSCPQKIVVRDREIQFFLRGALQNLDITIEYAPDLPLINEVFQGLQKQAIATTPELPEAYSVAMMEQAELIWQEAPWETLDEQQIIAVELNRWDIETAYISVLGMMGVEFGVLMYRSLNSLKQFREKALQAGQSPKQMQQAFLEQDCIFLTFDPVEADGEVAVPSLASMDFQDWLGSLTNPVEREPTYGSLHPLEGLRTHLINEEALSTLAILAAFRRFLQHHRQQLDQDDWPELSRRYRLPNPDLSGTPKTISVTINTCPDLMRELALMEEEVSDPDPADLLAVPVLRDDFVPANAVVRLAVLTWDAIAQCQTTATMTYQSRTPAAAPISTGLPIVLIHTSQSKGQDLIQYIQSVNGLTAVCFNIGEDPFDDSDYDILLVQTGEGSFHMVADYPQNNPHYQSTQQRWRKQCQATQGRCALAIAKGGTGKHRGNPPLKDYIAIYEVTLQSPEALGLPPLQLQYANDWI